MLDYEDLGTLGGDLTLSGGGRVTLNAVNTGIPLGFVMPIHNLDNEMSGTGLLRIAENGGLIEAAGGALEVGGAALTHTGLFAAGAGGTLEMQATVTGSGSWRADGGRIHVTGDVQTTGDVEVLHGGSLAVDSQMSVGNLVVDDTGSLDLEGLLKVAGSVDFDGPNGGRWTFGPSASLEALGGSGAAVGDWAQWKSLEAAGRDMGLVAAGFASSNFYLADLVIGPGGRIYLRDERENGNHVGPGHEVVYVDTLVFSDALGLIDLNGITLYYNHLVGSPSQIIDQPVPEPAMAWLCGLGLALLGRRGRCARAAQQLRKIGPEHLKS